MGEAFRQGVVAFNIPDRNAAVGKVTCRDGDGVDIPVDLHARNGADVFDQALIAQIAEGQVFRRAAKRHQRHQFALVEVDGEGMLASHRRRHLFAAFVDGSHDRGRRTPLVGEDRTMRQSALRGVPVIGRAIPSHGPRASWTHPPM